MYLKNIYNHIKMCLNVVTLLLRDLFFGYQSIKRNSEFAKYFILDSDNPSYYWNLQIYTSLGHSLIVAMTNGSCVKFSMAPQAYKVVSTHAHEISGWTIISRLIHSSDPLLGGTYVDVQYDLATLAFKIREQLEDFHGKILRL